VSAGSFASRALRTALAACALAIVGAPALAQDAPTPSSQAKIEVPAEPPGEFPVRCAEQVKPYLPHAVRVAGIEGLVEATVLIKDGAVLEVLAISGPPALHATVILALARYKCTRLPEPVIAKQKFDFRFDDDADTEKTGESRAPAAKAPPTAHEALATRLATQIEADKYIQAGKQRMEEAVDAQVQNFLAMMNGFRIPADVRADLDAAVDDYKRKMADAWSSKSAMDLYVSDLAQVLGDEEISGAIAYFSSAKGSRLMQAFQHANATLDQYVSAELQRVGEREGRLLASRLVELRARVLKAEPRYK
jgi:hypothetical protein